MCTLRNSKNVKMPKTKTFTAYKVFNREYRSIPHCFMGTTSFKIGTNIWNVKEGRGERGDQDGFQVFVNKKDAKRYAFQGDFLCPVKIETKNVVKAGLAENGDQAYEVKKFVLSKKTWENKKQSKKDNYDY